MRHIKTFIIVFLAALFLTACQSPWDIEVDLTPEQRADIYQRIDDIQEIISNQIDEKGRGEIMAYINIARAYEDLGKLKKAEGVYKDLLADGRNSNAIHHNLGRLYEKVGEYEKAVEQYQILVDKFFESNYLYDITWAYIRSEQRKEAEKYFNMWQLATQSTDIETQDAIKELRAKEKAAE